MQIISLALACVTTSGVLAAPVQSSTDVLVPGIHHTTKQPQAWLEEFESSGGSSRDALWCLFHANKGVPPTGDVRDRLLHWLVRSPDEVVRLDLETILTEWGFGYTLAPEQERMADDDSAGMAQTVLLINSGSIPGFEGEGPFVIPLARPSDSLEALRHDLESDDRQLQATAAIELGRRRESVPMVVRRLVGGLVATGDPSGTSPKAILFSLEEGPKRRAVPLTYARGEALSMVLSSAGSEASDALLEIVADGGASVEVRRCALAALTNSWNDVWLEPLARVELPADELHDEIERSILQATVMYMRRSSKRWRPSLFTQGLFVQRIVELSGPGSCGEKLLEAVSEAGRWSEVVRSGLRSYLAIYLCEGDPLEREALAGLVIWDEPGPWILESYVRVFDSLDPEEETWPLPVLHKHSSESRAALRRAFASSKHKLRFIPALGGAGLLNTDSHPEARDVLAALGTANAGSWHAAFLSGMSANLPYDPQSDPEIQPFRLGIAIRAARATGRNSGQERTDLRALLRWDGDGGQFSNPAINAVHVVRSLGLDDEAFIDWCLTVMADDMGSVHGLHDVITQALLQTDLSPAQQAQLYRLDSFGGLEEQHMLLLVRQGLAAIEWSGSLRQLASQGDLKALDYALQISGLTPRDERTLIRELSTSTAAGRATALKIIEEHGLDTPGLREAVKQAREDGDREVSRIAKRISW